MEPLSENLEEIVRNRSLRATRTLSRYVEAGFVVGLPLAEDDGHQFAWKVSSRPSGFCSRSFLIASVNLMSSTFATRDLEGSDARVVFPTQPPMALAVFELTCGPSGPDPSRNRARGTEAASIDVNDARSLGLLAVTEGNTQFPEHLARGLLGTWACTPFPRG